MADYADLGRLLGDGGRDLTSEEKTRAEPLLGKASRILFAEFAKQNRDLDAMLAAVPPTISAELVADVVCDMVRRALPVQEGPAVTQQQMSAGTFSQGVTYASPNPDGSMYLTRADRRRLGLSTQQARTVDMFTPVVTAPDLFL